MSLTYVDKTLQDKRRNVMVMFCALLFISAIFVADVTSVKVFLMPLFGRDFLLPAGALAFCITFLVTDVVCEVEGNRLTAIKITGMSYVLRFLTMWYFIYVIGGDERGRAWPLDVPIFWTTEQQQAYKFVFGGTVPIYIATFVAGIVAFINDIFIFNYMREIHKNKNLYWLRNGLSTTIGQVINSTIFMTIAFAEALTIPQIISAIIGMIIFKVSIGWIDIPLSYLMRNYGQGRSNWYAIWKSDFWKG